MDEALQRDGRASNHAADGLLSFVGALFARTAILVIKDGVEVVAFASLESEILKLLFDIVEMENRGLGSMAPGQ